MATDICDVSPCHKLQSAIGHWVMGSNSGGTWVLRVEVFDHTPLGSEDVYVLQGEKRTEQIEYCPFCGTCISEIGDVRVRQELRKEQKRLARHSQAKRQVGHTP